MSESIERLSPTELLVNEFLQKAKDFQTNVGQCPNLEYLMKN